MNDLNWLAPIEITDHARGRARARLDLDDEEIIRGEIRAAILLGRVATVLPNWARLNGHRDAGTHPLSRYVWDPEADHVWVLTRRRGYLCVKTLILNRESVLADTERRHLRR